MEQDRVGIELGVAEHGHQQRCDIARVANAKGLRRPGPHLGRLAAQGQERQGPRRIGRIDLAQELQGDLLMPCIPAAERLPDRRHGPRVGHGREGLGQLGFPGLIADPAPPLRQDRRPVPVGFLLGLGFGALRGELLVGDPAPALLAVAQVFPRGLAAGLELDHARQVRGRLGLEPLLLAPERHLPVGLGGIAHAARRPLYEARDAAYAASSRIRALTASGERQPPR